MEITRIVELINRKYGQARLIINEDGSGRITYDVQRPYESPFLFSFGNLLQLIAHLEGQL